MNVRAKMLCTGVTTNDYGQYVTFQAVYGKDGTPNAQWSAATPNGNLTMTITNKACFGAFEQGKEYFVDLSPAPAES